MHPDLEALLRAFDAWDQAGPEDAVVLETEFQDRLNEEAAKHAGLEPDVLLRTIRRLHVRWLRAQQRPPSLPPRA